MFKHLKKQLGTVQPFITKEFFGQANADAPHGVLALAEEGKDPIPLKVEMVPPSMKFIMESGTITSIILRYSDTYRQHVREGVLSGEERPLAGKEEAARSIIEEIRETLTTSDDEQAKMMGMIVKIGREYLCEKATHCYYNEDRSDKAKVIFTMDKEAADRWNAKFEADETKVMIWVDSLDDVELVNVGMEIMSAIPTDAPGMIPISEKVADDDTGEVKEGVIGSVPANEVASFPRDTRSFVVEDAPKPRI